jgi:hypothetical protein
MALAGHMWPSFLVMSQNPKSARSRGVVIAPRAIEQRIFLIRSHRVMLDRDLADLYGVATRTLNQAVARNINRFPSDFAFHLTPDEGARLRSQSVISNARGGRRYAPRVFTEQGVAMLSSVLRSRHAIDVNVAIVRAFVHLRELLATHKDLVQKLDELERKYDGQFAAVFDAIRELMAPSPEAARSRPRIGFIRESAAKR